MLELKQRYTQQRTGTCISCKVQRTAALRLPARRRHVQPAAAGAAGDAPTGPGDADAAMQAPSPSPPPPALPAPQAGSPTPPPRSAWERVKGFFTGGKLDRQRLQELGMGAFASYGVISNLNYGTALTISWLAFVKQYGVAPTAPGQWPVFLAFYAGMWAIQNFARPLRFSLAIALAPFFDRAIARIAAATGLAKQWAFGLLLACVAVATTTLLFGTISALGGFPPAPAVA